MIRFLVFALIVLAALVVRDVLDGWKAGRSKDDELVERLRRWGL